MNCFLKSFITKRLNKLLDERKESMNKARLTVNVWLSRTDKISNCLKGLSQKLEDNELTDEELADAIEEFKKVYEEW